MGTNLLVRLPRGGDPCLRLCKMRTEIPGGFRLGRLGRVRLPLRSRLQYNFMIDDSYRSQLFWGLWKI